MYLRIILAASVLALAGCAGSSKVMVGQARPPIDPAQVQVYTAVPPGSQEIAQLEASSAIGFGTQGQTDAAVERLKREAAALGANGVVLIGMSERSSRTAITQVAKSLFDNQAAERVIVRRRRHRHPDPAEEGRRRGDLGAADAVARHRHGTCGRCPLRA